MGGWVGGLGVGGQQMVTDSTLVKQIPGAGFEVPSTRYVLFIRVFLFNFLHASVACE